MRRSGCWGRRGLKEEERRKERKKGDGNSETTTSKTGLLGSGKGKHRTATVASLEERRETRHRGEMSAFQTYRQLSSPLRIALHWRLLQIDTTNLIPKQRPNFAPTGKGKLLSINIVSTKSTRNRHLCSVVRMRNYGLTAYLCTGQ